MSVDEHGHAIAVEAILVHSRSMPNNDPTEAAESAPAHASIRALGSSTSVPLNLAAIVSEFQREVERVRRKFPRVSDPEAIVAEALLEMSRLMLEGLPLIGRALFRTCATRRAIDAYRTERRESVTLDRLAASIEPGHRHIQPQRED